MDGHNEATLIGSVGKDVKINVVGSNSTPVASFTLATNNSWKDKTTGERKQDTQWHNIETWSHNATFCGQHVKKGDLLLVQGPIITDKFERDGVNQYRTKIRAEKVTILNSSSRKTATGEEANKGVTNPAPGQTNNVAVAAAETAAYANNTATNSDFDENDNLPF